MKVLRPLLLAFAAAGSLSAAAAPPVKPAAPVKPAPPAAKAAAGTPAAPAAAASRGDGVVWDGWYTVTVNQNIHYAYYNDRVERKSGRLNFQNRFWKQEEGYTNEEQLSAFAQDDADLTPLFFNFHSTYRTTETTIDGTIKDGKILTVKIRKANTDLPLVRKSIPTRLLLSSFFPVWLANRLPSMKQGTPVSFASVLEDNLDVNFQTIMGTVRLEPPDNMATKTKTQKILVDYRSLLTTWYLDAKGIPYRTEMPSQKTVIQRVTQEAAQKFLDE